MKPESEWKWDAEVTWEKDKCGAELDNHGKLLSNESHLTERDRRLSAPEVWFSQISPGEGVAI